jgi:hypothetical protein
MRNNVVCILTIFVSGLSLIGQILGSTPKLDLDSTFLENTWRPIISMPWITYGSDFGGVAGWHTSGISSGSRIDPLFERLEQDGVAAVVWFLFGDGRGALTFDPSGYVTGVVPSFWADYHAVLAAAERHHLRVVWVLTDFEIGMPVQLERGVQKRGRADLLEDPAKRHSLIKEALEPILKDKTASGQVAGWIVLNEPEHLLRSGYVTDSTVRAFVTETAAEIKHYHPEQPVGLANTDLASMIQFSDLKSLDFLVFHHYGANLPPPAAFVRDYLRRRFNGVARSKPIFIGEFNLNFPPGMDLDRFVLTCREFGFSGVWPWSLQNRLNPAGSTGTDTDPQFPLLGTYTQSMLAVKQGSTDMPDRKKVQKWAITELQAQMLPEVKRRVKALGVIPAFHKAEAKENREWAIRCQNELFKASAAMKVAQKQARRADGQFQLMQDNIDKQKRDLATATERARMHSYLAHEASAELTWLEVLEERLADTAALVAAVDIDR